MSEFDTAKKSPGVHSLQRKNLLQARQFDDEVQQEIFPTGEKKNLFEGGLVGYDGEEMERVAHQKTAIQHVDSAMEDLASWRDARNAEKNSNELNFNALESDSDDVSAKIKAFVEEELASSAPNKESAHKANYQDPNKQDRLHALIKENEEITKSNPVIDLSSLSLQNLQVSQMQLSRLGTNYLSETELKAAREKLMAQLEADDAALDQLKAKLNTSWDADLDDLLGEPRK